MTPGSGNSAARFLGALGSLAAIVVVAPWILALAARSRFGGASPLHGVPAPPDWEWSQIRRALADELTEDTIADIVVRSCLLVAWFAIILLVVTVAAEMVHMIRHGGLPMPAVRGLGGTQSAARLIAAGLLVVLPMLTSTSRAIARDSTGPVLTSRAPATASSDALRSHDTGTEHLRITIDDAPHIDDGVDPAAASQYVVQPGDSVYAIARRIAGPDATATASYADQLLDLNIGRRMPDGQRFDNAAFIDVGWVLELPVSPGRAVDGSPGHDAQDLPAPDRGHVVEHGETLWSIAEDELGAAERWPEIYEANLGRTFEDGRTLDDPSLIQPGWDLELPGATDTGLTDSAEHPAASAPQDLEEPLVVEEPVADTEPDVVAEAASARPSGRDADAQDMEPQTADQGTTVSDARPTNRWIHLPAGGGQDGVGHPASEPAPRRTPAASPADVSAEPGSQLLTVGRAAMLSAGVLTLVAVRRRNRLRRSHPGTRLLTPTREMIHIERALRSTDPAEQLSRVDLAVRAAAPALCDVEERVVAVIADDDGNIELRASGAVTLDAPWERTDVPDRWMLAAELPVEPITEPARRMPWPCPTLVQLGRTVDERDLYVDLEALGAIEVGGAGDQADAIVTAVATTLAGSVLAEVTTLVAVGVDDAAFLGHRHHVSAGDNEEAFRRATVAIGSTATVGRTTFELRVRATGGESWEPAVVLCGAGAGTVTAPTDRTGLAVVSASPIHGASSRLAPDGDAWVLRPLGVRCVPIGLTDRDLTSIAALVASADADLVADEPLGSVFDLAVDAGTFRGPPDDDLTLAPMPEQPAVDLVVASAAHEPIPGPEVLVRLLGPVVVESRDGRAVEFGRSKAKELIAWLATHRDRSTRTAARTALWELDVRDATFANVVSEARRSLARLAEPPQGEEWIGRTLTESLPLHALVRTDAELVRDTLAAARAQSPEQAICTLRPAVELVVGLPFEGTSYLWPEAEGIASELLLLATSATSELAALHLSMGDIDGVFEATGRGLRVLPGHEALIGLRMRAHARLGDRAGVRHEWEQYERVIAADPWSDGAPSTALVELRRELLAS